jgi:hypothetical protein
MYVDGDLGVRCCCCKLNMQLSWNPRLNEHRGEKTTVQDDNIGQESMVSHVLCAQQVASDNAVCVTCRGATN